MPNIFFDITGLVWHLRRANTYTGIQRTVVMLIEQIIARMGSDNIYLSFYDTRKMQYRSISMSQISTSILTDPRKFRAVLGIAVDKDTVFLPLRSYANKGKKYTFHLLRFYLNGLLQNKSFFRRRNVTLNDWKAYLKAKRQRSKAYAGTEFSSIAREGDHLISLDGTWTVSRAVDCFRNAKNSGIRVHTMIYDLIPIVRPDLSPEGAPLKFYDWLLSTLDFSDRYLAISHATQVDLDQFLKAHNSDKPTILVPLAQDLISNLQSEKVMGPLAAQVNGEIYPQVLETTDVSETVRCLLKMPYVLCVGTLEVRKNNWRIALAWDLLRKNLPLDQMPKLVFAGRPGWMNADFDRLMAHTGQLDGFITLIEAPSDADLALLYKHCSFTLLASLYEGWGLPVGESLSFGKTAVVSRSSSLPEVGGDLVTYCDPMSPDSIMQACRELIIDPTRREALEARIRATRLRSWGDVADDLIEATINYKELPINHTKTAG